MALTRTSDWPDALRRYLVASLVLHLAWEIVQLPLYTLWRSGSFREQALAIAHCTVGDLMIAGLSLLIAFALVASPAWPATGTRRVWPVALQLGAGYTIYSEWLNVKVRGTWAYSELMPVLPLIGTGLAPLMQWVVAPTLALWIAIGRVPWGDGRNGDCK